MKYNVSNWLPCPELTYLNFLHDPQQSRIGGIENIFEVKLTLSTVENSRKAGTGGAPIFLLSMYQMESEIFSLDSFDPC